MPDTPTPPAEQSVILQALSTIRWRLFSVRLAERFAVALSWSAAIALPLTAARLTRDARYLFDTPWLPTLLAFLPLIAAFWLFRRPFSLKNLTITPFLARFAAIITSICSIAMIVLTYLPAGALIPVWSIPVAVISLFLIAAAATVRVINNRAAAIYVDQQVGLRERVSTALELLNSPAPNSALEASFNAPVIASALQACQEFRTARVGYNRLGTPAYALAALAVTATICLSILSPVAAQAKPLRPTTIAVMKNTKDLQQVLKELEAKDPNNKIAAERLTPLKTAINQIQQGNMGPIESKSVLNEAKEQMKRDQESLAASGDVEKMLKQMQGMQDFAKSADELKDAQVKQNQGDAGAGQQQKTAEQGMKDSAKSMGEKLAGMSEKEKNELAENLRKAAESAKNDPQLQKDLQNASNAAKNGNSEELSSSMQAAGERMGQQGASQQMSQAAANRAMSEIDRMQGGGPQSTMNNGAQQSGPSGGGSQGQDSGGDQNGGQKNQANQGGQGDSGGSQQASGGGDGTGGGQPSNQGSGSTNLEQAGSPGGRQTGPTGGKGTFVRVYDQRVNESNGTQEKVASSINPRGAGNGSTDVMGAADKGDPSIKTYQEVLPEARQRAMDELTRQEYPPQYQEMVRQFYSEGTKQK